MEAAIIMSGSQDVNIKREIGQVSILDGTDRDVVIAGLRAKAFMMEANAIIDLRISSIVGDSLFQTHRLYARGKAVKL